MSNSTYDRQWQDAMADLNEQVHIEDHTLGLEEGQEPPNPPPAANIVEAFQHFACLYIKYMQIFQKLSECYDNMVHPQKRIEVKKVLEVVMCRVIELKHALVKWNPPNPDAQFTPEQPFSWEYVSLDDILIDLKLPPHNLDVPVPQYFKEDSHREIRNRDRLIQGYMNLKLQTDKVMVENEDSDVFELLMDDMSVEEAIELIQINERGRQGRQRAILVQELREEERQRRMYEVTEQVSIDTQEAASNIQRLFRGFHSRAAAQIERDEELIFIGMKPARPHMNDLEHDLDQAYLKRKEEQKLYKESYDKDLVELKEVVLEEEGPEMRDKMAEERRKWMIDEISGSSEIPETLEGYYKMKNPEMKEEGDDEKKEEEAKPKKKEAKKDKKDKKAKGGKKKGKKGKDDGDSKAEPEQPPQLVGPTELTNKMGWSLGAYENVWLDRDEIENFAQKHETGLAKDVVRPTVEEQVRKQVDEMLVLQLEKIKAQIEDAAASKKGDKKKKKGGKKKGGKKGGKKAKGAKTGKKDKGKKKKALPGEKIVELKNMDTDHMLSLLVESKVVNNYRNFHVSDFWGEFDYLGTVYQNTDRRNAYGDWIPQNPSMAQVRQNLTEYAILPNGSNFVKSRVPHIRSILIYGPKGVGKTMLAETIANELGAIFINLSPSILQAATIAAGKTGPTKLMHIAFQVAKDPLYGPAVIYIDQCETILQGGKKKGKSGDGPDRFKKDLQTYAASLGIEDRVILIGNSREPWLADPKEMRNLFDKFLYVPYPDYASRTLLWQKAMQEQLALSHEDAMLRPELPDDFEVSTLAHVSEGYSSGSIVNSVRSTLTERRVERLDKRHLTEMEFVNALSRCELSVTNDKDKMDTFSALITGLKAVRDQRKQALTAEEGDGGKEAKKGKKGKGKKKK